jgi:hypothetical protein
LVNERLYSALVKLLDVKPVPKAVADVPSGADGATRIVDITEESIGTAFIITGATRPEK